MIDLLRQFFSSVAEKESTDRQRRESHDVRLATCAVLLEMANIDGEFAESEKNYIVAKLSEEYGLSDAHAAALIEATREEREKSTDLWQFTNLVNEHYSTEEKAQIIEMVWRIAYSDGRLDKYEDYLVHKLSKLLRLSHEQLIEAKLKAMPP